MAAQRQEERGPADPAHARVITFDGWTLRTAPRELLRDGLRVRLQDQPLQILEELVSRPGQLVTREQLTARLWPKGVVDFDGSLNTAVRKLRAALTEDADAPKYIETIPRLGYRFIGQLDNDREEPQERLPESPAVKAPLLTKAGRTLLVTAFLLAVVLASAVALIRSLRPQHIAATPIAAAQRLRIAILPFENLSPDPADGFFTDGLHEEILTALANRAVTLDVISRTTMMMYRATPKPVPTIAAELGVTHVLEGSVRREGKSVRLTLQLIDARNDSHLWSQNYDRELTSAMMLQSQVAAEVASQLAVTLSATIDQLGPSADPRAYDLYLKAKLAGEGFAGRASLERILEVEGELDRAIALDPSFAAAYLLRARIQLRKFDSSYDLTENNLEAVRADLQEVRSRAGEVALLLATESYYAHAVDGDLNRALALIGKPQVMASKDLTVLMTRAALQAHAHRVDEALAIYQEAAQLDPENQGLMQAWHALLWNARRPAGALRVMRELNPQGPVQVSFVFAFTGRTEQLDEQVHPVSGLIDPGSQLMARVNRLRLRNRLADSIAVLERTDLKVMRQDSFSPVTIPAIGRKPVAELHGWAMLLAGDRTAAARDGKIMQDFVSQEKVTRWNVWFMRFLAAEADLFCGNKTKALAEVRTALAMTPRNLNIAIDRYAPAAAALILAWAGAQDEAVGLLAGLSSGFPGVGPAEITRDPLYRVPLVNNPRYKALEQKLELEIAANQKLFDGSTQNSL